MLTELLRVVLPRKLMARVNLVRSGAVLLLLFLASLIGTTFFFAPDAQAFIRDAKNPAEQSAYNLCVANRDGSRGAIWVTSADTRWYYGSTVSVTDNQTSVAVAIRGSFYSCNYGGTQYVWAEDVRAGRSGDREGSGAALSSTMVANGARLTSLSSTWLYRGFTNAPNNWSNYSYAGPSYANEHRVEEIRATLNVSGVATTGYNASGVAQQSISIPIYRCFFGSANSSGSPGTTGVCYVQIVPVNVQRKQTIKWTLSPTTTVNKTTAKPGEVITWTHTVRNNGPTSTARNASAAGGANISGTDTTFTQTPWTINSGFVSGAISQKTSSYTVRASDVGNSVCRGTTVSNYTQANTGWTGWRDIKCVSVAYNFNLVPTINIPGGNVIEPGSNTKINVTGNINNNGLTKSRPGGNWQISRIVFNGTPSATQKQGGESSTEACGWSKYNSGKRDCNKTNEGTWTGSINNGSNFSNGIVDETTAGDEPVGTTVCFVLSIQPYAEGSSGWRHSDLQCITYGKKPKVQVWGGDVIAGRSIDGTTQTSKIETSLSVKTNRRTETTTVTKDITFGGPASGNDISGVWNTGVNDANRKVGPDLSDDHWRIRTVFNTDGYATCARGYHANNTLQGPSPSSSIGNVNWQAVTVGERRDALSGWPNTTTGNVGAGGLSMQQFRNVAGDVMGSPRYVWDYTRNDARWVGANVFAHDYSSSSCKSSTIDSAGQSDHSPYYRKGNTTVFTLKNGINIADTVDLDTVSFSANLVADNLLKFYVNGKELKASPGSRMFNGDPTWRESNWQEPAWFSSSTAGTTGKDINGNQPFKHGHNTFEVHIKSTYTNTGMMIYNFGFKGKKHVDVTRDIEETKTFGSWGEYGLVANGQIKGMASGAGFFPENSSSDAQSSWSKLTFANVFKTNPTAGGCNSTSPWGCYAHKASMPNIESLFSGGTSLGAGVSNVSVNSLKGQVNTKTGGTINISGGTLNSGEWAVINAPTSTVNITGNINYASGPVNSVKDIPQMIIIANNINISPSVGNVDSWLIAKNALATCDEIGSASDLDTTSSAYNLSSNDCKNTLRVNGPVMAKKLWLRRTAGAGTGDSTGDPAEVFNYRPDAMLWINNRFNNNALRTTNLTELPPRY